MKIRAFLAATAAFSWSFSAPALAGAPITPPAADAASADTLNAMTAQCNAAAAVHGPATGPNDHWTGQYVTGDVTLGSGPTEVVGTKVVDTSSIQPLGTYVPSVKEIRGNPVRTGGSVNMFGEQWSTAGYYPDSTYNYTANYNSTFAHAFTCNIYQAVYHKGYTIPGTFHPAVPPQGCYTNPGHATCDLTTHYCNSSDAPGWGTSYANNDNCLWHEIVPGQAAYSDPDTVVPDSWDAPTLVGNEAGGSVNQDQTDVGVASFEPHGGRINVTGEHDDGQVVICISPGSKGGSWKAQNGYGGGSFTGSGTPAAPGCNTPYFKIAPITTGSTTSQGTFTSVPQYNLP
ncbi:MAG: hypothetical protein HOP95_00635 [Sphingomonas sp.]|nr:hypothetical protein [Sphingomonas sp.]